MRRRGLMALLALGVVVGYGSGFAHLACARHRWEDHRQQMMGEFARTCIEAAHAGQSGVTVAPTVVTPIVIPVAMPAAR